MAYLQLETMKEMAESEIRSLFPNTSFTTPFTAPEGFEWVFPTPSPTVTELQVAVRNGVEQDSKGNWVEKWAIRDMFSDIVEDGVVIKTKTEQEEEYLQAKFKATVPSSITPRQIRLQLTAMGLRQQVEDWVATQSIDIKDWWEFTISYERSNQMLINAAANFGLTSEQLDLLFIEANKL